MITGPGASHAQGFELSDCDHCMQPHSEVLQQYGVMMEGMLFKPAMIVPGAEAPKETPQKVAT